MSKVFINKKKASEVIKLYKNSTKVKKIGEKVNLSIYVLTNFLKKKKIFEPHKKQINGKLGEKLLLEYLVGKTVKELSKNYKIHDYTLRIFLKKNKVFKRHRDNAQRIEISENNKKEINKLYKDKFKIKDISLKLNLTDHVVKKYLRFISVYDNQRDTIVKKRSKKPNPKVSDTKLVKEWDFKKNLIGPENYTTGSDKKVFWICPKCKLSYPAVIQNRFIAKSKCSYCSNMRVSPFNNLKKLYPNVAKTFHPTKNGKVKTDQIIPGSHKKYWWICENKKHHIYKAMPYERSLKRYVKKDGTSSAAACPFCAGKQVYPGESWGDVYKSLTLELDKNQEKGFNIYKISVGSIKNANWVCVRGHKWRANLWGRANRNNGCPKCKRPYSKEQLKIFAEYKTIFEDLELEYKQLDTYSNKHKLAFEYDGVFWHKNKYQKDKSKTNYWKNKGIKIIRFRDNLKKINDHDVIINKLAYDNVNKTYLNIGLKNSLKFIDDDKIRFKIQKYIKSQNYVNNGFYRKLFHQLPFPVFKKSFAGHKPKLAKFWNYKKNFPLKPEQVPAYAKDIVHMRCDKGHEFSRRVNSLSSKKYKGCPICSGKTIIKINSFGFKYPELVKVFDKQKSKGIDLYKIGPTSVVDCWWKCRVNKDHSHFRRAVNKALQPECPYCRGYYPDPSKTLRKKFPDLAKYWSYKKNNLLKGKEKQKITPDTIHLGAHYKVFLIALIVKNHIILGNLEKISNYIKSTN